MTILIHYKLSVLKTCKIPTFLDHLHHDPSGPPGLGLTHHALAHMPRVQTVIQSQASDVAAVFVLIIIIIRLK